MEWIVEAETREDLVDGKMVICEEIVRCMDCKYMGLPNVRGAYGCKHRSAMVDAWVDGYCSYGERRSKNV